MANQEKINLIDYMMNSGEFHDEQQAKDILLASLRALRDRLPTVKAFRLGKQLPEPLRHSYLENWNYHQRKSMSINKSDFLAEVNGYLKGFEDHSLADLVPVALEAVIKLITREEAEQVKEAIPASMLDIFSGGQSMD